MGYSRSRSRSRDRGRRSRSGSRGRGRNNRSSRSRSYSRSPTPEERGHRVHVADLGIDCSKHEVESIFGKYGDMEEVWLARNPPCFAFIVYRTREQAEEAIREMDGKTLCGGRVRVSFARPRTKGLRRRRGFDPNLRCYQCGERGHFSRDCDEIWRYRNVRYSRSRSRSRSRYRGRDRGGGRNQRRRSDRSRSRDHDNRRRRDSGAERDGGASGSAEKRRRSGSTEKKSRGRRSRSGSRSRSNKDKDKERKSVSPGKN